MLPEPVLYTSIRALPTWKSTTLHASSACPMRTLDPPGSLPAARPNRLSADQYDLKPIGTTSCPDRTTGFLLTALSEPLRKQHGSRCAMLRWSGSDRDLPLSGSNALQVI